MAAPTLDADHESMSSHDVDDKREYKSTSALAHRDEATSAPAYKDERTPTESAANDLEKNDAPSASKQPEYVQGWRLWTIVIAVTLVYFLLLLDTSVLATATPQITKEFHSFDSIGWYGAAYILTSATLLPLTGKIFSNFDLKWTFFVFFLLFELGSLLCAVSTSNNMFIVSRAVGGMGAAGLANGALSILTVCAPMPKRPALMGVLLGGGQVGLIAGPLFGGLFTQYVTWRWCFYINLPIGGLVAALLAFVRLPQHFQKPPPLEVLRSIHHKLDLIGFGLMAPWSIMLLLALEWGGNSYAWDSATIIGLFGGGAVTFVIWLGWDFYKKDAAMIPINMLRQRYVWTSCLYAALMTASLYSVSYYMPVYFQGVRGKSSAISGVYLLPSILPQLIAAVISGKLLARFGYYLPWAVGSAALTAIGYGLLSTLTPYTSAGKWIGYQIIAGAGRGCGIQIPVVAIQNTMTPQEIPVAMSVLVFSQTLGGAVFLSVGATVLTNSLQSGLEDNVPGIDVQAVLDDGANGIRGSVSPGMLAGVLKAYAKSIDNVFYMCTGLAVGCFVVAWAMGWVDIRKEKDETTSKS